MKSTVWVLDSFAILSFMREEAGAARVSEVLEVAGGETHRALLSVISLAEIAYVTERAGGLPAAQTALSAIQDLPLEVVGVGRQEVLAAAHVKAHHSVSLADAFVVALAAAEGGTVLTGDPEFTAVEDLVPVEWLPR